MTTTQLDTQIRSRLADNDVRYTNGRQRVVAAIARADGPRSAAELYDELGHSVPLSSLYRTLAVLANAGVLAPHHSSKGITRYELSEWLMGHHHHLVCVACGAVDDIELPDDLETTLERLVGAAASADGFTASGHALEIDGRCANCS